MNEKLKDAERILARAVGMIKQIGANKLENQYAELCRQGGVKLRRKYYVGIARSQWGAGGDYTGVAHPRPKKKAQTYDPSKHVRIIYAGGKRRHA